MRAPATRLRPRQSNESKLSSSLTDVPPSEAIAATSPRTHSAMRRRHRTAQRRRRLQRHAALVPQHHGLEPDDIVAAACARPDDRRQRRCDRNFLGQREPAGGRLRRGLFDRGLLLVLLVRRALLLRRPRHLDLRRLGRPGPRQRHARARKCGIGTADQQQRRHSRRQTGRANVSSRWKHSRVLIHQLTKLPDARRPAAIASLLLLTFIPKTEPETGLRRIWATLNRGLKPALFESRRAARKRRRRTSYARFDAGLAAAVQSDDRSRSSHPCRAGSGDAVGRGTRSTARITDRSAPAR